MTGRSYTAGILGVEGHVITVDATVGPGLRCLSIVGRVNGPFDDSHDRVLAAIEHAGHPVPAAKQIVNLAPADLPDVRPACDLAIACALLSAHELIPSDALTRTMLWAKLASDGTLQPGVGAVIVADTARQQGFRRMIVAEASAREASMIHEIEVLAMRDLAGVTAFLRGETRPHAWVDRRPLGLAGGSETCPDLSDVRGLRLPRRGLEIMIAGGHNLLLHGPSGVGKTMLARRIPSLMPDLELEDAIEVSKIHSIAYRKILSGSITRPPLRMPHHSVSVAGLLGGGNPPRLGEVSLAHHGVLFLDDLPEFTRSCIDRLHELLEDSVVTIAQGRYALRYPARIQLMAACPSG